MDAAYRVSTATVLTSATDHDSLIHLARIQLALVAADHDTVTSTDALTTLDTLWADRYTSATASPGFGLDFAFDAATDGTTNPADTIYGYTTAMAALAYLDAYALLGNTTQLDRAEQLATTLLTECWGYVSGAQMSPYYSNHPNDNSVAEGGVVYNIAALTLAVLARIDRYNGSPFDATKRAGIEAFIAAGEGSGGKAGRWLYRLGKAPHNDLTHHAYMVEGVVEAGTDDQTVALLYMWSDFFLGNTYIDTGNTAVMGAADQKWGPGDALSALVTHPDWELPARLLAIDLAGSVDVDGISSYSLSSNPRSVARYGLGLARYAARILGDGALFAN